MKKVGLFLRLRAETGRWDDVTANVRTIRAIPLVLLAPFPYSPPPRLASGDAGAGDVSSVEQLCKAITKGDIPCETTNEIEKYLWAKMLYNCALNSLGAILDVPYGVLAKNKFARIIMNGIAEEVFGAMTAAGYKTHWPCVKIFFEVFYNKLVPDTAEHKSSTLQDISAKKKTEIDALNGAVIGLAEKYKIPVPCNLVIYNIIKFIEAGDSR